MAAAVLDEYRFFTVGLKENKALREISWVKPKANLARAQRRKEYRAHNQIDKTFISYTLASLAALREHDFPTVKLITLISQSWQIINRMKSVTCPGHPVRT